jgi:phage FluMu protein Com
LRPPPKKFRGRQITWTLQVEIWTTVYIEINCPACKMTLWK